MKAGGDGRLKVPVEMNPDRWRNLLIGWLEVAMANVEWEQGWKHLLIAEEDWLGGLRGTGGARSWSFCSSPWLAFQLPLRSLPQPMILTLLTEELEHDEVDWLCWLVT